MGAGVARLISSVEPKPYDTGVVAGPLAGRERATKLA